jgi:hypothetical protein
MGQYCFMYRKIGYVSHQGASSLSNDRGKINRDLVVYSTYALSPTDYE